MPALASTTGRPSVRGARLTVGAVALAVLAIKLYVAATTWGTNDIGHWYQFSAGVRQAGPVGIYGVIWPVPQHAPTPLYNHGPLVGYLLLGINAATHVGLSLQFTIRALASAADVVTAFLVLEILRTRRGLVEAMWAGVVVAASPVLIVISGFHGNTDPIFVMLTLLSLYLLADRKFPFLAGLSLAAALSVKIVPIVVVPALFAFAVRKGRRTTLRASAGFLALALPLWLPPLLFHFRAIERNVFGYTGVGVSHWGLFQIGRWLGNPSVTTWMLGPGRLLALAVCAGLPALAVWRRPDVVADAVGLALVGVLVLSPAFSMQYLVWAAAASLLVALRLGVVYNLLAGVLLVIVYTRWNAGLPWNVAHASDMNKRETALAFVVWMVLAAGYCWGLVRAFSAGSRTPSDAASEAPPESADRPQAAPAPTPPAPRSG
jgi:hypothetical protein